ncbi:ATP-binding cassette domain-containing protein [Candidatus Bathyarchaeota archaeon]|nr:ATP-binding cassette domain-containing protein [Candidatus Bathyarchaeota archaeon]
MNRLSSIRVNDLTKIWGEVKAVDHISFSVDRGEIFGFLGPNGAGKTTTIKMLVGLTKPTRGSAYVAGYNVMDSIRMVKQRIGVVPERSNLYNELTVTENLRFVSKLYHVPSEERETRITELLEIFQLTEYRDRDFAKLSKGLKRRVVIAAALIHNPEIIFLDEPTSGLDIMSAKRLREIISDLSEQGVTIFLTTHYIEEAGVLCDRIALLVKGKIVEIDTPEGLRSIVQDTPILRINYQGKLDQSSLNEIHGEQVSSIDGELSILTKNIHATLESLIIAKQDITIQNIETIKPKLEDAFIQLTGVSLESMRVEKEGKQ